MKRTPVYLRSCVQIDPLIHRWYAWVQIIPPASAAFNVLERQIRAMKSFCASPDLHVDALSDPAMRGGPFIALPASRAPDIRHLLLEMAARTQHQSEFVDAVRSLDSLLEARSDGGTLQTLYSEIPPALTRYVELVYDRHHRADFKLFEAMLYDSPLYDESAQSVSLKLFAGDHTRPFIFSTPRLPDKHSVDIRLPFRSPQFDKLFATRTTPSMLSTLEDELEVDAATSTVFRSLFTESPPRTLQRYESPQPRLRYFGHACVLLEAGGVSVLLDPIVPYGAPRDLPYFTYDDIPACIDYVFITHGHHDHIMLETLMQLRHRIQTIVVGKNVEGNLLDPSLKLMLHRLGFRNVIEASEFDEIDIGIGTATALPFMGEHHDLHVGSKLCYHFRVGGRTVLFAADSCNFGHGVYERAYQNLGAVDVLFIGMECDGAPVSWVYGPAITRKLDRQQDQSRRGRASDSQEALALIEHLKCSSVYIYAMGSEPWIEYVLDVHYSESSSPIVHSNRVVDVCRASGIHAERLHGAREILLS